MDLALRAGLRGLPNAVSLAGLLEKHRGVRNIHNLPHLTEVKILAWADAYCLQTGLWPKRENGEIPGTAGETWLNVDQALAKGLRGCFGGSSLARLLAERRGVRNHLELPRLTIRQILIWADALFERYGQWPKCRCLEPSIEGASGEQWLSVDRALRNGLRGLRGGSSLACLLARYRGVRYKGEASRS